MTTETLSALNEVREAKTMVLEKLTDTTISQDEKQILGAVLINLQEQEDILINFVLQDMVDKINSSNAALQNLIEQMDSTSQKLAAISNTIKKVSNILSTLTDITTKAIGSGLLG